MDISTKTIDELKSLAYDQIAILERAQTNLRYLNEEIAKRSTVSETKATAEVSPVKPDKSNKNNKNENPLS
jgi:uncharacterized coiled-coil protein SlyX